LQQGTAFDIFFHPAFFFNPREQNTTFRGKAGDGDKDVR
jgi:hypothetical protein